MANARQWVGGMTIALATAVGIWNHEGWTETAVVPVKGDVPTVGPGLTKRADGTPVRMGDTITPLQGINRSFAHLQKVESRIKQCVTAPVSQVEFDLMFDFSYQYGESALCRSNIVKLTNAQHYMAACEAYGDFRKVRAQPGEKMGPGMSIDADGVMRYDCSTLVDGKPNRRCWGVWKRQIERINKCKAAQ